MKRKHKKYSRPKRPFDKARIEEEKAIVKEFGLKNKKEVWKADAKVKSMREKAKKLINNKKNNPSYGERIARLETDMKNVKEDIKDINKKLEKR